MIGEYDRPVETHSTGENETFHPAPFLGWHLTTTLATQSSSRTTQRQRVLTPGEIAQPPQGTALMLVGAQWRLAELTPYYGQDM